MKNDKEEKENRLLNTAFRLFTEKGIKETSIQEIVDNASVAKGTFYLYFRDKYEIRDILIVKKSQKLFSVIKMRRHPALSVQNSAKVH